MSGQTITKSLVDSLEKQASEYTVWDAKLPGFGVRVRPTGAKSFVIVYRAGTGRTAPVRRYTVAAVGKLAPEAARILGTKDHWTRDGRYIEMIRYQSVCAEPGCKRNFLALATKSRVRKGQLNKRCELHHSPGIPVQIKKARKKRAKPRPKKPTAAARLAARRERAVNRAILAMQRVQRPSYLD
ncbi:hypothetical protein CWO91_19620 [Bradyrhizobium genosp. SA-3]|uniref:Arm DNA-binding domain-containing protein n=1 Tax=Bradyrhizobium genosp. SA-3 TaxID=508868 RepID=UPI0010289D57|nr:Arm DNA-binding domain-containing protein [Bradyrhizobium genosp. SA-3]RZN09023.1 hypothetical protein CWO91_19620 [Bradyrhizobium genosp. SA-3]